MKIDTFLKRLLTKGEAFDQGLANEITDLSEKTVGKLFGYLAKPHSHIRHSTVELIHHFFLINSSFRQLILDRILDFIELTITGKLPWPEDWADKLKSLALQNIKEWHTKFSQDSPQLILVMARLATLEPPTPVVQVDRPRMYLQKKYEKFMQQYPSENKAVYECMNEIESLLELLVPIYQSGSIGQDQDSIKLQNAEKLVEPAKDYIQGVSQYGLGSRAYQLEIQVNKVHVERNQETSLLLDTLSEKTTELEKRFQPLALGWLELVTKAEDEVLHV